jgi:hypothetical protein
LETVYHDSPTRVLKVAQVAEVSRKRKQFLESERCVSLLDSLLGVPPIQEQEKNSLEGIATSATSATKQHSGKGQQPTVNDIAERFDAELETTRGLPGPSGVGFPTRRCYACNGWLFWVSVYGVVRCAGCHPPANRALVSEWYWLPEGEQQA